MVHVTPTARFKAHSHRRDWTEPNCTMLEYRYMYELPIQFSSVPEMRMGLHVSRQRYKRHVPDDQRCWSRCVSLRQLFQVDTERRGGWTQMLGSETCSPIEKSLFCLPHPHLRPPLRGNPLEFLDETYPRKTRGMGLLYGENCVILATTVFDWSTREADGRTDGRAELPWHKLYAL